MEDSEILRRHRVAMKYAEAYPTSNHSVVNDVIDSQFKATSMAMTRGEPVTWIYLGRFLYTNPDDDIPKFMAIYKDFNDMVISSTERDRRLKAYAKVVAIKRELQQRLQKPMCTNLAELIRRPQVAGKVTAIKYDHRFKPVFTRLSDEEFAEKVKEAKKYKWK